jgi:hypothetical protein
MNKAKNTWSSRVLLFEWEETNKQIGQMIVLTSAEKWDRDGKVKEGLTGKETVKETGTKLCGSGQHVKCEDHC